MKKRFQILLIIIILLFSYLTFAETSSSSINWASRRYVEFNFCKIDGNCFDFDSEPFLVNVESCIDDPCLINSSKNPGNTHIIVSRQGRKFLWRTEP